MAVTNHERVGKALTLLRDGIKPELEKAFKAMFGENWVDGLNQRLHQPDRNPDPDDLAFLLKGMEATWNDFFREVFSRSERSYVALLRDARNDWAHNKRFSSDETYRILDFCEIDRKSTRLNSSHVKISYAVFCSKKKNDNYHANATLKANHMPYGVDLPGNQASGRFSNEKLYCDIVASNHDIKEFVRTFLQLNLS